jgi:hypothetical protein
VIHGEGMVNMGVKGAEDFRFEISDAAGTCLGSGYEGVAADQ